MNTQNTDPIPSNPSARPATLTVLLVMAALLAMGAGVAVRTGVVPWPLGATAGNGAIAPKYHCPMHPTVVSDKPGACPICGMDLVPIGSEADHASQTGPKSGVPGMAVVPITAEARRTMGLKLGTVEKRHMAREVRTSARIVADETRLWRVTTKIDGWVDQLFVAYTGQEVKKGDPLLTLYSPVLVSAQEEYLILLRGRGTARHGMDGGNETGLLAASARRRLELLDISAEQIEELTRTGKVKKFLTLYAPASGVVTGRDVLAGQKITAGDSLMVIADLSVVWGEADIYESDLPYVKTGMPLELSLPYWPGKVFNGKVIFVSPTLDGESRTLRARLEIPNSEALLKPGAYGDARLFFELGEKLGIPASAVMVGGQSAYAFRDAGDGRLFPVELKLGARCDDYYEVLGGLNAGDKVVVSANFLVDSESNLKAAMDALAGNETAGDPPAQAGASKPGDINATNYAKFLTGYFALQAALAVDDLSKAQAAARSLAELKLPAAQELVAAPDLADARNHFRTLSAVAISAAHQLGAPAGKTLYRFVCPMAFHKKGGEWLQTAKEPLNPYLGTSMPDCGDVKEEIPGLPAR